MNVPASLEHRRLIACMASAAVGACFACYLLWPGTMNVDALIQLEEGRTGMFYGWHPPLMGWIWSILDRVIPGPGGMFLLHHLMFWPGLGLVVYQLQRSPAVSATLILVIGALPPVLSALGTLWKDVGMGGALLLAFGLLFHVHRAHSARWLVFVIALLFYAVGTRYNAALAALPLFLWLGQLAARRLLPGREPARLIAVTVGVGTLLVIGGLNWSIAKRLVDDRQTYPSHQIMVHDLIGISVRTRSVLVPSFLADTALSLSAIDCVYSTHDAVAAFSGSFGRCPITLRKLTRAGEVAQLRAVWLDGIRRHPRAYTAHRWDVWLDQLALGVEDVHYPLQSVNDPNRLGIESLPSRRHDRALQLFSVAAYRTPLFRAWPYLLIAVAVLVVGIRITADPVPLLVLVSSAVLYELGYIVISTGSAFRFNWWPVVAAIVAVTFIIPRRELPG